MQLAQINVARLLAPLDDVLIADFVAALDPVNAVADRAPGFVWRLDLPAGDPGARILDDDWLIVNMSVWESVSALGDYVYAPEHREVLSRRREWFHRLSEPTTALWWVPVGHQPTPAEGEDRLLHLRANGPSPHAFTLRDTYAPPGFVGCPAD